MPRNKRPVGSVIGLFNHRSRLYAKLESGLGHAFNELYWSVDGDKTPLLTVTNFSDTMERIDIWTTRDRGSKILRTVELPAKASVHLNMRRGFAERSAELSTLQSEIR